MEWGGTGDDLEGWNGFEGGLDAVFDDGGEVAQQVAKTCTGRLSGVRLVCALAWAEAERLAGATGEVAGGSPRCWSSNSSEAQARRRCHST